MVDSHFYHEQDNSLNLAFLDEIRKQNAQKTGNVVLTETVSMPSVEHLCEGGYQLHPIEGPSSTIFPDAY